MSHIAQLGQSSDTPVHSQESMSGIQQSTASTSVGATSTSAKPETPEQSIDYAKAKGSYFYKANMYHTQLMKRAQELTEVTSVTLQMEINCAMSEENLHFAELIAKCSDKLIDIGEHLKSQSTKIKAAWNDFIAKQKEKQASAKINLWKLWNSRKEDILTLKHLWFMKI